MNERLVEHWLDSATERSYQAPLCQMLAAQGYRVLHSTRHGAIELGKDIIAIDPAGIACAFQLKGNPGGRLTLAAFREIEAQLHQLVVYPLVGPGMPQGPHRSFLVTNGYVEEEARLAIERMNAAYIAQGLPGRLEIVQRGDLLAWALELGESLWPSELVDTHSLLEILVQDGRGLYPVEKAHKLLLGMLGLRDDNDPRPSIPELRRRITSASLLIATSLKPYDERENHYAAITAWTMFCCYAIAASTRHERGFADTAGVAVSIAEGEIEDRLVALLREAAASETLTEGDVLADSIAHAARYLLLLGLGSALWFRAQEKAWPAQRTEPIREFLRERKHLIDLWGEGAYPQGLAYYWFLRATDATVSVETWLLQLIAGTVQHVAHGQEGLASPYFDFDAVSRHRLARAAIIPASEDPLRKEAMGSGSFFVEALLHLLVRTNRKQACKAAWPHVSRLSFDAFVPDSQWSFCLWHTDHGTPTSIQPPLTKNWIDLLEEARHVDLPEAPTALKDRVFLLLLFLILCPYRAVPSAVRYLGWKLDATWMIGPPIGAI